MKESQINEAVAKTIEAINHASPLNPGYVGIIVAALEAKDRELAEARACHLETLMQNKATIAALEADNMRLGDLSVSQNSNLINVTSDIHKLRDEVEKLGDAKAIVDEQLSQVDEAIARRPALADCKTRYDAICKAIRVAKEVDSLRQHLRAVCDAAEVFSGEISGTPVHEQNKLASALTAAKPFLTAGGGE